MAEDKLIKRFRTSLTALALLFLAAWGVRSLNLLTESVERETRFLMDTYVSITAIGPKAITAPAVKAAFARLDEIAVKFNALDSQSPLFDFNHNNVPLIDPEILGLIERGLKVSEASEGAFDMTVAPLSELWGFYSKSPHLPADKDIKAALKNVGWRHLQLADGKLTKDLAGVHIDLGGIAKGYALEEAAKVLKARGVTSAMIDAGGDVYVVGRKGERPWNVGIQDPRSDSLVGFVKVQDTSVIGSGDYERFFIEGGRRYHHIFNPRTGYPTQGVTSVTLIHDDPVLAQAWAKAPFVLGPEKGLALLATIPGMKAIVILESGEKLFSKGSERILNAIK